MDVKEMPVEPVLVRGIIRNGNWPKPTPGLTPGSAQVNLAILPKELAFDFLLFCQKMTPSPLKARNSWCRCLWRSHRMHDDLLLNCLCGCVGGPDSLFHYLQCPHLFARQIMN